MPIVSLSSAGGAYQGSCLLVLAGATAHPGGREPDWGETWRKMRAKLEQMHLGEYQGLDGRVLRRTETTPYQQGIFKTLGIPEPPHFHLIEVSGPQVSA